MEINEYRNIHYWIRTKFGKASKCEFTKTCKGKSKTYDWALKKGCEHARKRENYIELCKSCHAIYDRIGVGRKMSKEARIKMSKAKKGITAHNKGKDSRLVYKCPTCKTEFKSYRDKSKKKRYCSLSCRKNRKK
jgi:hypothetical protein